jgi:hypothetical protein
MVCPIFVPVRLLVSLAEQSLVQIAAVGGVEKWEARNRGSPASMARWGG